MTPLKFYPHWTHTQLRSSTRTKLPSPSLPAATTSRPPNQLDAIPPFRPLTPIFPAASQHNEPPLLIPSPLSPPLYTTTLNLIPNKIYNPHPLESCVIKHARKPCGKPHSTHTAPPVPPHPEHQHRYELQL